MAINIKGIIHYKIYENNINANYLAELIKEFYKNLSNFQKKFIDNI